MNHLQAQNISFSYHSERPVLQNVSIEWSGGEWLTLLGPNGTGKTTLMRCILNQLQPQSGQVFLAGKAVDSWSARERARFIAYVPQSIRMPFGMPVIDTVLTGRLAFSPYRYTKHDREVVADVIEKMHLEKLAFRSINELSGGERQRVWIARALAQEAELLCMDEPTTGMDPENQLLLLELIRRLIDEKGIGVLMTLHDLNLAGMFSDRIALLYGSHLYAEGTPAEVLTKDNIYEVYRVHTEVTLDKGQPHVRLLRQMEALGRIKEERNFCK